MCGPDALARSWQAKNNRIVALHLNQAMMRLLLLGIGPLTVAQVNPLMVSFLYRLAMASNRPPPL